MRSVVVVGGGVLLFRLLLTPAIHVLAPTVSDTALAFSEAIALSACVTFCFLQWVVRPLREQLAGAATVRRQSEEMVARQHALSQIPNEIVNTASDVPTLAGMVQVCTDAIDRHLDTALVRIWLYNQQVDVLELTAQSGCATSNDPRHARIPNGEQRIGWIAQSGRPFVTDQLVTDNVVVDREWVKRENLTFFAGYPLQVDGSLFGVLGVYSCHPLSPTCLNHLEGLAHTISGWILRRHTVEQLRDSQRQLKELVSRRTEDLRRAVNAEHQATAIAETLKTANAELEVAREAAESASRAKSDFLANMSHELRTPLHGVIGMTELLMGTELNERQRRYVALTRSSGETLMMLINDVLDFSKIEAGKLELERVGFSLSEAVATIATSLSVRAESKNLEFVVSIHPDVPAFAEGDPKRVQQILLNLVGNAIKFTDDGEVVLRVSLENRSDNAATVRFAVTDTGIGIPQERLPHLFQAFTQCDASTTREYGGTGLGLAICKRLVDLMGGEIGVESELNNGSTFWFTVPLRNPARESAASPAMGRGNKRLRILAVDDNATNREIIGEQLSALGYEYDVAAGAEEALASMYAASSEGRPFDMAILDMSMPRIDGEQLGRIIKADERLRDTILLLVSSAIQGVEGDRLRQSGFAGWLMKPVWRSLLGESIVAAYSSQNIEELQPGRTRREQDEVQNLPPSRQACILVADDNEIGREIAVELLTRSGFTCETANNGQEAVERVIHRKYDAVLMDCQMPIMDGYAATRAIREHESSHSGIHLPIIALTANALKGDQEQCLAAGMDDYLTKPLNPSQLTVVLTRHLDASGSKDNGSGNNRDGSDDNGGLEYIHRASEPTADAEPPLDLDACCIKWGVDRSFLGRLLEKFLQQLPVDMARLEEQLKAGDAEQVATVAHALKGAAGYVNAARCEELCATIEGHARAGILSSTQSLFADLQNEAHRCFEYIVAVDDLQLPAELVEAIRKEAASSHN